MVRGILLYALSITRAAYTIHGYDRESTSSQGLMNACRLAFGKIRERRLKINRSGNKTLLRKGAGVSKEGKKNSRA
jgi:hypothetical protein